MDKIEYLERKKVSKNIKELCGKCKQAELCDITKEHKEMKYEETKTCSLFIKK